MSVYQFIPDINSRIGIMNMYFETVFTEKPGFSGCFKIGLLYNCQFSSGAENAY